MSVRVFFIGATVALASTVLAPTPAGATTCTGTFTAADTPKLVRPLDNHLVGVSVASPTLAFAVGNTTTHNGPTDPLILRSDGSSWHATTGPGLGTQAQLWDVTAISTTEAVAVGWAEGDYGPSHLIERWNGSFWHVAETASGSGVYDGVAATGPHDVWAVGYGKTTHSVRTRHPYIEHFGHGWHIVPAAATPDVGTLAAVTARTRSDAWAVGHTPTGALIEHWNGTAWTAYADPNGDATDRLASVVSIAKGNVWAVGSTGSTPQPLIEHWNGSAWTVVTSPDTGAASGELTGVAAASGSDVWAVGSVRDMSGERAPLSLHSGGGSWAVVPTSALGTGATFAGIDLTSTTGPFAVGTVPDPVTELDRTFAATWSGTDWSRVSTPNHGIRTDGEVSGISATSDGDVWGVETGSHAFLHWDGTSWTSVPYPAVSRSFPLAISAVDASHAWAVGTRTSSGASATLAMRWDGTDWTIDDPPTVAGTSTKLVAVSADSTTDAWAVGSSNDGRGFVVHRTGTTWVRVTGVGDAVWNGVVARSPTDVWIVGAQQGATTTPVAMHWNGATWTSTSVATPPHGMMLNWITAVPGTHQLWAVGETFPTTAGSVGVTLRWTGTAWKRIPAAATTNFVWFSQVAAVSATDAYAIGLLDGPTGYGPLVERWDGSSWTMGAPPPNASAVDSITVLPDGHGWLGLEGVDPIAAGCGI